MVDRKEAVDKVSLSGRLARAISTAMSKYQNICPYNLGTENSFIKKQTNSGSFDQ